MSDRGLAVGTGLNSTYDNEGSVCCKHMKKVSSYKNRDCDNIVCALPREGVVMNEACVLLPRVPVALYIHTCKQNAAVFLLTFSLVKIYHTLCHINIIPCVTANLFLFLPGFQYKAGLYTVIANRFLFLTSSVFTILLFYHLFFDEK